MSPAPPPDADPNADPPPPTSGAAPASRPKSTTTARPPRSLRRRLLRVSLLIAVLLLAVRLIALQLLPGLVARTAADYGLECHYERLDLTLLSIDLELWHLVLAEQDAVGTPDVRVEYLRADVGVLALLTGRLVVQRIEADGLDVSLVRGADGEITLLQHIAAASAARTGSPTTDTDAPADAAPGTEVERDPGEAAPLDLHSPIAIDALRLQHIDLRWRDESVSPPFEARLRTNLRLSDLSSEDRSARLDLSILAAPLLDVLNVEGRASTRDGVLDLDLQLGVRGLRPRAAAAYLEPLGIEARAEELSFACGLRLLTRPPTTPGALLAGELHVKPLVVGLGTSEAAALDELHVDIESLGPAGLDLGRVRLDGLRATVATTAEGRLRIAGVELPPSDGSTPPPEVPDETSAPFSLRLGEVSIENVELASIDERFEPPARLELALDSLALRDLVLPGAPGAAPPSSTPTATFDARLRAPGIAQQIVIIGSAAPMGAESHAALQITASGIAPVALQPWLEGSGLQCTLDEGLLSAGIAAQWSRDDDGTLHAGLQFEDWQLTDGDELLALERLAIEDAAVATDGEVHLPRVELTGLRLPVRSEAGGAVELAGLRIGPPQAPDDDHTEPRSATLQLDLDIEQLTLPAAEGGLPTVERAVLALGIPGLLDELSLDAALGADADGAVLTARLDGRGVRGLDITERWYPPVGIAVADGRLGLDVVGHWAASDEATHFDLALRDLAWSDAAEPDAPALLGWSGLQLQPGTLAPDEQRLALRLDEARVGIRRDPDGDLVVAGFALPSAAAGTEAGPAPGAAQAPEAPEAPEPADGSAPAARFVLDGLDITDARVDWQDDAVTPPVSTSLAWELVLGQLIVGDPDVPTAPTFSLDLSVLDGGPRLGFEGSASTDGDSTDLQLALTGTALHAGPFAPYMPPGLAIALRDGRLAAQLQAHLAAVPEGGQQLEFTLSDLDLREAGADDPLLAVEQLHLGAPRIDPDGPHYDVRELALRGVQAALERTPAGALSLLGISLSPDVDEGTHPVPEALPAPPVPVAAGRRASPERVPEVHVEHIELGIDRLAFRDRSGADAEPLVVRSLRLVNSAPLVLRADAPESSPPMTLQLSGGVDGVVESLALETELSPFAISPSARLTLDVRGVQGAPLLDASPDLAAWLDPSEIVDGRLQLQASATISGRRRHAMAFELSSGVGAELELQDLSWAPADGQPWAGLDGLRVEVTRIVPGSGDVHLRSIEITGPQARIEQTPEGLRALGLLFKPAQDEVPGPAPAQAPTAVAPEPPAPLPAATTPEPAPAAEIRIDMLLASGIDVRFEDTSTVPPLRVALTGLDAELADFTTRAFTEPRPLRFDLLLQAGPWSEVLPVMAATEDQPRPGALQRLMGALPGTSLFEDGEDGPAALEGALFDELEASGTLTLAPALQGRTRTTLRSLDMTGLAGPAAASGVNLRGGLLDANLDLHFTDDGALDGDTLVTFTDLDVSEPANGPIERYLRLPTPLGPVLFVLRDEQGVIKVPLDFQVAPGGLSYTEVTTVVLTALGNLIVDAIANSPFRVAGAITDVAGNVGDIAGGMSELVGLDQLAEATRLGDLAGSGLDVLTNLPGVSSLFGNQATVVVDAIDFAPADVLPTRDASAELARLGALLRDDESLAVRLAHEFGRQDILTAERRANPPPAAARALGERLRAEKHALQEARRSIAAELRATLAARLHTEAEAVSRRLTALDDELGRTEQALDYTLDLLRPGAEHQARRRTRAASLEIAAQRLEQVQTALVAVAGPECTDRIRVSRPRFGAATLEHGGRVAIGLQTHPGADTSWWGTVAGWFGSVFDGLTGWFSPSEESER